MRDRALKARGPLAALALSCAGAGLAFSALAHGPAPAALEVLSGSTDPVLVRTSVGLAARSPDGSYEYVCPSRWDGNERALAAASEDGQDVIVHSAGVAYRSRDAGCTFAPITGDDRYVTAAVRVEGGFALFAEDYPADLDPDRSWLVLVSDEVRERVLEVGAVDGALAAEGRVLVSGARPRPFVAIVSSGGAEPFGAIPERSVGRVTIRAAAGDTVWLLARDASEGRFWRVASDGAFEEGPAHNLSLGPVRVGARWLAVFDGVLHEHPDGPGEWRALGEVPWTCLRTTGELVYACHLDALSLLSDGAPLPEASPRFSMRQLGPPRACGDEAQVSACRREWAHYGGESGWLGTAPARTPTEPRRALSAPGCGVARRGGTPLAWLVGIAMLTWVRRRR